MFPLECDIAHIISDGQRNNQNNDEVCDLAHILSGGQSFQAPTDTCDIAHIIFSDKRRKGHPNCVTMHTFSWVCNSNHYTMSVTLHTYSLPVIVGWGFV